MPPITYVNFTSQFMWFVFIIGMVIITINFYFESFRRKPENKQEEEKCKKDKE